MDYPDIYRCVVCYNELDAAYSDIVTCEQCHGIYPVLDDISLFVPQPAPLLWAYIQEVKDTHNRVERITNLLTEYSSKKANKLTDRAHQMIQGLSSNLDLMEQYCRPISSYLRNRQPQNDFLAWVSGQMGFPYDYMLPYFYQDWFGTPDFEEVKMLFCDAMRQHCPDGETVAVLGAGACGLLYAMSKHFRTSFGVDLSLPLLLTAKRLIDGNPITVHLKDAGWKRVDLLPPRPPSNALRFVVNNIMNLPFRDGSLSAVTTQYLMHAVGNPIWLMREIHRVLKVDGVWINFSVPFRAPSDPVELGSRTLLELPDLLKRNDFEMIKLEEKRFRYLNLEKIYSGGVKYDHEVHFFVVRKADNRSELEPFQSIDQFVRRDDSVWSKIPKVVTGREVSLISKETFALQETERQIEIDVRNYYSAPIPTEHVQLLEKLFGCFDGERTLGDIFDALCVDGIVLGKEKFLELIRWLNVDHYLIELQGHRSNVSHLPANSG